MKTKQLKDNEKERLGVLKRYQILDSLPEEDYDRLTQLASIICDVPISLISLIDDNRQWFKSNTGLDTTETPRSQAFCHYAIQQETIFEIEDATQDKRFKDNPLVNFEPHIRFYAGVPLIDPDGYALGTICVIDRKPRKLTHNQQKALELLSKEVMTLIVQKKLKEELSFFEKLFKYSHDFICMAGMDGYFKKVNPAFQILLGWSTEELKEKPFIDFVHPDDRELTRQEFRKLEVGEITLNFQNRFVSKSGSYFNLQWVVTPDIATGILYCIASDKTYELVTEEKIRFSENQFRSFFENSQGLMCTHDLKGNFLSVNNSGAQLLGYSTKELSSMSLWDIIPEKHHPSLKKYLFDIEANGINKGIMSTLHKNGSAKVWYYNNIIEKDQEGVRYVIGNSIDITDQMRLESDLNHVKETLEETNKLAKVGAWEVNMSKQTILWSEITREIHEVPGDFQPNLAKAIDFYKEGESRNKIQMALKVAMEMGTGWDLELQIITAKGNEKWVRALGKAVMEDGVCKRLYGAFHDIDEKKLIKISLEESENKYRAFFDNSPVGVAINRHMDGLFIEGNQALFSMIGYTEAEYRKLSHWDVTPAIFDEQEMVHRESLSVNGKYGPYEKIYLHKDGHEVAVLLNGVKFLGANREEQVYSVIQNISERKKAEKELMLQKAKLAAFVEYSPAAVAMLDREFRYVAVSNRWLEEYKMKDRDIIGLSHFEVFPEISDEWKIIYERSMQGSVEIKEEDIWRPAGWNYDQYLRWETRPWFLHEGTIGGIMIMNQDITEISLQREELKSAKMQAEQANIAKSEFLASMSHEIRTPLNGVIGFTDLILKTKLNETQEQYLNIVNQSGNALLSIINDILDFSKIEAGRLELEIEKCDLYEMGSQSADMISYQIKNKELEMLLNISTELPRFIYTDSVRLKQVLINLLSNASKFTEKGEIELKIEPLTDPKQKIITIRFEVRDTGMGIRKDKQKQIFQAFTQEDGSVTRKFGGTGLGLTISNKLLALMGSRLQLVSSPGKGSRFFFDVSLTCEEGEQHIWRNLSQIKKVMVVDDNENNRLIVTQMLLLENIHTTQARNGMEALQFLEEGEKFDVILMDYNMPVMDGLETIRKIRENYYASPEEQPIMLLSSSADHEKVTQTCKELKVNSRLIKPIKMQDLYKSLSRLVKQFDEQMEDSEIEITTSSLKKLRVMIAEDGEVNMLLARIIIQRIAPNAEIIEVNDGTEAVNACKEKMPDIILMDIQMPEMNGYEATRKIRELPSEIHVPIIAITAGNVKGEREKSIAAGMDDFIAKPIVEATVAGVFNKWLSKMDESSMSEEKLPAKMPAISIDIAKLRSFLDHDEGEFREFLQIIKNELVSSLGLMEACYLEKSATGLQKAGHKLKGTTLSAYMEPLSKHAITLNQLTEFDEVLVSGLMKSVRKEIAKILSLIEQVFNSEQ